MIQEFFPVLRKSSPKDARDKAEPADVTGESIMLPHRYAPVGLLGDTLIETELGTVRIQLVRPGDRLRTPDGALVTARSVRKITVNGRTDPWAAPIRFAADAFGKDARAAPLLVAPGQQIHIPEFGGAPRLRPASEYLGKSCVTRADYGTVTYFVVSCEIRATALTPGALVTLAQAT